MKHSSKDLPKALAAVKDSRQLFKYFFRKAALWPESLMAPKSGVLRRVVLFSEGFDDRFVQTLERVPNLQAIFENMEEVRLVATAISEDGVRRLGHLLPKIRINVVGYNEWAGSENAEIRNPRYNMESRKIDIPDDDDENTNFNIEDELMKRYGRLPEGFPARNKG